MSDSSDRPRRALFGIAREEYERLQAALAAQRAATEEAEAVQAELEARDRARTARFEAVLADATTAASELDAAAVALAQLAAAEEIDEQALAVALRRLLPRRATVEVLGIKQLPAHVRSALAERPEGVVTMARAAAEQEAEAPLSISVARAGEVAVVVGWAGEVYDDGPLRTVVEQLCHAAAASLAARALARDGARRLPVSLLGGAADAVRFTALREAQEQAVERVTVRLRPGAPETYSGIFGEPAWDGERFHVAQALDRAARELDGEAFELDGAFACVVPRADAPAMRDGARAILDGSSIEADLLEP